MMNKQNVLLPLLAASLTSSLLASDTLVVEGDLDVQAAGTANGDLTVDRLLIVNPDDSVPLTELKANFRVEESGVIWAGHATEIDASLEPERLTGPTFLWLPEKGAFRANHNDYLDLNNIGDYSAAFGEDTYAGDYSAAFGEVTIAGNYSFAAGYYNHVYVEYGASWGYENHAGSDFSTVWGDNNVVEEGCPYSTIWGRWNTIEPVYSTVPGGPLYDIESPHSTIWGRRNYTNSSYSTIWGQSNRSYSNYSTVWGYGSEAYSYMTTVLGRFNQPLSNPDGKSWVKTDSLFVIGIGESDSNRLNAVTILKNGQTTLENEFWDDQNPTDIPVDADASGGAALVVRGHARFEGNLTLADGTVLADADDLGSGTGPTGPVTQVVSVDNDQLAAVAVTGADTQSLTTTLTGNVVLSEPQGDISMGIFGN